VGKPITRWKDVVRRETSQILEYEDGGDEKKTKKNGGVFFDSVQRPEVDVWSQMDGIDYIVLLSSKSKTVTYFLILQRAQKVSPYVLHMCDRVKENASALSRDNTFTKNSQH